MIKSNLKLISGGGRITFKNGIKEGDGGFLSICKR